jgi:hypothetical protein
LGDGPEKVYRAGESFAELPGDRHGGSANNSKTQSARLLAVFVVDTNEKNLFTTINSKKNRTLDCVEFNAIRSSRNTNARIWCQRFIGKPRLPASLD